MARMRKNPRYLNSAAAQIHLAKEQTKAETPEQVQSIQARPAQPAYGSYLAQFRKKQKPLVGSFTENGNQNFVAGLANISEVELIHRTGHLQRQEEEQAAQNAIDSSGWQEQ